MPAFPHTFGRLSRDPVSADSDPEQLLPTRSHQHPLLSGPSHTSEAQMRMSSHPLPVAMLAVEGICVTDKFTQAT